MHHVQVRSLGRDAPRRLWPRAPIAAGVDPSALVEAINRAKVQRDTVRADLVHQPKATVMDAAEVYAMSDSFGDVGAVIEQARPDSLARGRDRG